MNPLNLNNLGSAVERVKDAHTIAVHGKVTQVVGLTIEATGPPLRIGDLCYVETPNDSGGSSRVPLEVVGFRSGHLLLMALGNIEGVRPGSPLIPTKRPQTVRVGVDLLGRVLGSMGDPLDNGPLIRGSAEMPLRAQAPPALSRKRITEPIATGIRSIDACITCGKGQRLGIMAGSGVGKSKTLGMMARNTNADINVIALIGERGREVREFIEGDLGTEGLARSIVIVATSDEPALLRIRGAYVATAISEWFREQGADVMLMMDSVTRFAMAQREVGLAVGEPPTTRGYPPSVYALLPKLLERAGSSAVGTITGIYTVLVESDDMNDPIGDAVRSILDGHIVLSRDLASRNHYPAVDVLQSISRCMVDVTVDEHRRLAGEIRSILATYRDAEDLVNIGAYAHGSNKEIDKALRIMPGIRAFLKQGLKDRAPFEQLLNQMTRALQG